MERQVNDLKEREFEAKALFGRSSREGYFFHRQQRLLRMDFYKKIHTEYIEKNNPPYLFTNENDKNKTLYIVHKSTSPENKGGFRVSMFDVNDQLFNGHVELMGITSRDMLLRDLVAKRSIPYNVLPVSIENAKEMHKIL